MHWVRWMWVGWIAFGLIAPVASAQTTADSRVHVPSTVSDPWQKKLRETVDPTLIDDFPEPTDLAGWQQVRERWADVVGTAIDTLAEFDYLGRRLDVRENVKFRGRHLAQWIHERYPRQACVLSIEFKKFFMDEWTGVGDVEQIQAIRDALQSTVEGLLDELGGSGEAEADG